MVMKNQLPFSHYWWWTILTAFISCGLAVVCFSLLPPLYTSQGSIIVNFDFNNTSQWNDKTMLHASESVGKALYSPAVINQLLQQAQAENILLSENSFRRHSQAEQKFYSWVVSVESASAADANRLTQLWLNAAAQAYQQDMASVQELNHWRQLNLQAIQCLQQQPTEPMKDSCQFASNEAIHAALTESQAQVDDLKKSISFFAAAPPYFWLEINAPSTAAIQTQRSIAPVIYLLCAIAGFSSGYWSLRFGLPNKILPKGWLSVE